jgi:hypothetical protein
VAERVVHALELVEVERKDGEPVALSQSLPGGLQKQLERGPVRKIGERVVQREIGQALLRTSLLGHVGPNATIARERATVSERRLAAQRPRAPFASDVQREEKVPEGAPLGDATP